MKRAEARVVEGPSPPCEDAESITATDGHNWNVRRLTKTHYHQFHEEPCSAGDTEIRGRVKEERWEEETGRRLCSKLKKETFHTPANYVTFSLFVRRRAMVIMTACE